MNPGSVTRLRVDEHERFEYVFFSLGVSINGFLNHEMPVIVVDDTHLKCKYKGILFIAASNDGNEQVFSLAVGISDKENNNSWTWFME